MLSIITDTLSINEPDVFFAKDSVRLYQDLELKSPVDVLAPYSIIYQLKSSENGTMTLVAKKPYIKAETAKEDILGWVDNSLIKDLGTGLYVNMQTLPAENKQFELRDDKDFTLTDDIWDVSRMLAQEHKTVKYSPVSSYSVKDSLVAFRTQVALPLFDYSNNYIFNVDGDPISHKKYRGIVKELKKLNISFVFDGGEETIEQFPQIVNALQNLQSLFESTDDYYTYQFNCVMTFDETGKLFHPLVTEFTSDYTDIINLLSDKANKKDKLRAIKVLRNSWQAFRKSVESFDNQPDATNLIILIGDKRQTSSGIDNALLKRVLKNNCRIIGFQVYAGEGDDYNNFVLDIEDAINSYADGMIIKKRKVLVSPEQIKRTNNYTQVGNLKNSYRLDFPSNSITQGALFFPQKSELLPMEILTNNIDTIVQQIKSDNSSIIQYMSKAFRTVGNNRTRFDSLFVQNYGIDTTRIPQKKLIASFVEQTPGWYLNSDIVVLNDSVNNTVDYRLMLSEQEMKDLKEFIASLSEKEVDFIIDQKKKKEQKRKPCNCPDDDLFLELERQRTIMLSDDSLRIGTDKQNQTSATGGYANTKKVRKHLTKTLLKPIKYCKLCKEKGKVLKTLTLAEAQYRITGCPTANEMLNTIRIKDLKNKKVLTDPMLDILVSYYKDMKQKLDEAEQFESNGEIYYWVDRKLLP